MSDSTGKKSHEERERGPARWAVGALVVLLAVLIGATTAWSADSSGHVPDRADDVATSVAGVVAQRAGDLLPAPTSDLVVTRISVTACGSRTSGSGFLVEEGLIITAAHVVGDAHLVGVEWGSTYMTGEVLGRFADGRDVAVVAIDSFTAPAPRATRPPAVGEPITIVGHPFGGSLTVSVGPMVDLAPQVEERVDGETVGVATISGPGFSGGPAVDQSGEVIGMVVAAETSTDTAIVLRLDGYQEIASLALINGRCASAG